MEFLSHSFTSPTQKQRYFESIAKAFPETQQECPWFPDRPKLFLSALVRGHSKLFSFCCWNEEHLPAFLDLMRTFLELPSFDNKELVDAFHEEFVMIVVHVWMVDCALDKLEEGNYYPGQTKGIRKKMHKLLENASKVVVQGDSLWLGEHADWWIPKQMEYPIKRGIKNER